MYSKKIFDESIHKLVKLYIIHDSISENYVFPFLKKYLSKLNIVNKKKYFLSFDIEFNTPPGSTGMREIAIFQLCFHIKKYNLIIFFNPKLSSQNFITLIINILTHRKLIKIGHGTDSLDINAIYNFLIDKNLCYQFTKNLYDTRFLCEYLNMFSTNTLCNIYHLLYKYNIVSQKQYDFLEENQKHLGDFWNTFIDIKNLSNNFIDYSLYDALYLKYLIKKMFKDFEPTILKLLIQVLQIVLLLKKNIIPFYDTSHLNTFFNNKKESLFSMFSISYNAFMKNLNIKISTIFQIPLFKKPFIKIFMLIFYYKIIVLNKEPIFINKNNPISQKDISYIDSSFHEFDIYIQKFKYVYRTIYPFYLV
jgi:hypothetical protein